MPELPELLALPLRERVRLVETGEVSREEWAEQCNSWGWHADARYRACAELRPVSADQPVVRLGVKDTVDVAGFATRLGLRRHRSYPRLSAAPLRSVAGRATVNAKVVTTELNIGLGSGCVNPYFPEVSPAGSSTGSGVSVAAGICDASLGTDVLGSVRWPAGRCGVVGLRMTHDARQLAGVFPLCPPMDAPGWVARTADDLAFAWRHLRLGDSAAHRPPLRVGVVAEALGGSTEPEILDAIDRVRTGLADIGHSTRTVEVGELWRWRKPAWELCAREAWNGYRSWQHWITDDLLDSTRLALEAGAAVSDLRYAQIRDAMAEQRGRVAGRFAEQRVDAWLLPLDPDVPVTKSAAAAPASSFPDPDDDREVGYTPLASFAGLPAITFPVGLSRSGDAPLAVQLVGPASGEPTLIRLACDVAAALGDPGFRIS
jgi:Asp-tRNA(Asn)/Glu-tRNA(Gln) amidotransferase A subunit family amidase